MTGPCWLIRAPVRSSRLLSKHLTTLAPRSTVRWASMDWCLVVSVKPQCSARLSLFGQNMLGAQMTRGCRQSEFLQQAQALEWWAECRERVVLQLELNLKRLADQDRADQADHLRFAAQYLRHAALRDRAQAAALRQAVHLALQTNLAKPVLSPPIHYRSLLPCMARRSNEFT